MVVAVNAAKDSLVTVASAQQAQELACTLTICKLTVGKKLV